ncbi:uncharacterized protein LOC141702685 [Apium graveolens]|uniref:uncharacterized protein LOC141702685 n=1 Tax=Apium graveolens TaxID=4045 RepID=UPI003D797597
MDRGDWDADILNDLFTKGLWNETDNARVWKQMWRLGAPPKVLNARISSNYYCVTAETCPNSRDFLNILTYLGDNFNSWIGKVLGKVSANKGAEIAIICWAYGKRARKDRVWRNIRARVNTVVSSAMQYLLQWKNAQSKSFFPVTQSYKEGDGATLWVKPQGETIKVSVDATCFTEFSAFGIGVVARKSDGELIQAFSKAFQGNAAPELSQVIAIREAFSWLKDKALSKVEIESVCLVVVQAIRSRVAMISLFGKVVAICHRKLKRFKTTSLSFVKRSSNENAHYIARESYFFPDRVLDRRNVPI